MLDLFATLQVKPGSDMDDWSSAPLNTALAGPPTGKGTLEFLMAADWQKLWPRVTALIDRFAEVYPKETGDVLRRLGADYAPLYAALGPCLALEGDVFAADAMSMTLGVSATDATALRKEVDALLGKEHFAKVGITIAEPRTTETAGATITDRQLAIDFGKLASALNLTLTGMGGISSEQLLQVVFGGPRIPLRVATKSDRGVFVLGKQQDAAIFAALDGKARSWSKPVQDALARVADCNPLLVERIDAVAVMAAFARVARQLDETLPIPELPAGASGNFVVSGGIRGAEWRAGIAFDFAGLVKFLKPLAPR
jgi:hypothetical protein